MLNNIKLGAKLIASFIIMAIISAILGIITLISYSNVSEQFTLLRKDIVPGALFMVQTRSGLNSLMAESGQVIIDKDLSHKKEMAQTAATLIQDAKSHTEHEKHIGTEEGQDAQKVEDGIIGVIDLSEQTVKAVEMGKTQEEIDVLYDQMFSDMQALDELITSHLATHMSEVDLVEKIVSQTISRGVTTVWVALVIALLLGILLAAILTRNIAKPIQEGVVMMQEIGKGHLSQRLRMDRKDEIGIMARAMDEFADDLQVKVVGTIKKMANSDLSMEIVPKDAQDEISPAMAKTIESFRTVVTEVQTLTKATMEGRLNIRGNVDKLQGVYRDVVQGFNSSLDAVTGPLNELSSIMEKVAARDLSARVKGDYKGDFESFKTAVNTAVENLDKAIQQVAIGAEQVASASVQVSTGGQALSQGTSEQASSLEEVSSSLQEMSSMTKQNVSNAKEAKAVAEQTRESSDKGVESMTKLSNAINKIKASSDSTAKIVKTIDEIAFQTNLLALNAAVEAARAGDAGKGFAVVAEEVRNLAMRSAEAAKNTANLIEEAVKNSENGVAINAEVLKNFQEINERTNKVSQVVSEITAASEQQDQGLSQVNKAVEQMNQVTQQNAANAEESASAAEEMSSQSEEMRSMVQGFKLTSSSDFNQALRASSQSGHMLHNLAMGKKGGKAAAGIQPDPRKVLPLDDRDHGILKNF